MKESIWNTSFDKDIKRVDKDLTTDVLIVGGGIAGLLCAYELSKYKKVIVMDKDFVGSHASSKNTGKLTSNHGLIYKDLLSNYGYDKALKYYKDNEEGINIIEKIINAHNIDCDFKRCKAFSYVTTDYELKNMEKELDALDILDIKHTVLDKLDIPINIKKAYYFDNQAKFNPYKFIIGLKKVLLENKNVQIYEKSLVTKISNTYSFANGFKISTEKTVVCTNAPIFKFTSLYMGKLYKESSYIASFNYTNIEDIYLGIEKEAYSIRSAYINNEHKLLMCSKDHRSGSTKIDYKSIADNLSKDSISIFNRKEEINISENCDVMTTDLIPYIGRKSIFSNNIIIVTGFNKWGNAFSGYSSINVKDIILNNKYSKLYSLNRFNIMAMYKTYFYNTKIVLSNFFINNKKVNIRNLKDNEHAVITKGFKKIGVVKKEGKLYYTNNKCPHMGCNLIYNEALSSWDCPCHASRFSYKGDLILSPSKNDICILEYKNNK